MTAEIITVEDLKPLKDQIDYLTQLVESQLTTSEPMTVKEYAKKSRMSESAVRRWCVNGKINAKRVGDRSWRIFEV